MTWGLLRRLPRSPQRPPSGWLTIGRKYDEDAWHGRARDRKTAMLHFFLLSSAHDLSPFFINNLSLPLEYYILFLRSREFMPRNVTFLCAIVQYGVFNTKGNFFHRDMFHFAWKFFL